MSDKKRVLNELRVIDLRAELEKRNLDKSGVRGVLIQRLAKYLEDEGHDPATYKFDLIGSDIKSTPKRVRRSESAAEADNEDPPADNEDPPAMEDMVVQDDVGEEEETEQADAGNPPADNATATTDKMEVEATEKTNRKRDLNDGVDEATEPKKPCIDNEEHKNENNTDPEDSINLDIGDDELLNEEPDTTTKVKQDDGANEEAAESAGKDAAADNSAASTDAAPADGQQNTNDAPATSNDGESESKDDKDEKPTAEDGETEKKKEDSKEGGARNLWVSGLSGDTRAKDLKQLCSKHGKVIGAKIVTNARTPGSRCYGYVTMASAQDAENCIKNLHKTELHGRIISVEKAKSESESSRRQASRDHRRSSNDRRRRDDGKENDEKKDGANADSPRSTSRARSHRSDKDRPDRTRSHERRRSPREVLSFSKIMKERDIARMRDRSRLAREEERRRRAAEEALRERERRQRQEKHRLELEREKLRAEREKIEREKNELLRLERERHRLEREKLELERLELKRAQLRLEEERRKRGYESSSYRKPVVSPPPEPAYDRDSRHKRAPPPAMSSGRGQFEAPPPPRFDIGSGYDRGNDKRDRDRDRDRDYKRDYPRHVPAGNIKYPPNGNANDAARQPLPPGTRPKEPGRPYDSRDNRNYRPSPPSKPEPRNWNSSNRYPDAPAKGSGEGWTGGEARYGGGGGGGYEPRYPPAYQPPPPGAAYPDRYAPPQRDYRKY